MTDDASNSRPPLLAVTAGLLLGGSTTFLLNLVRAFHQYGLDLPIVVLTDAWELRPDFEAAAAKVACISPARYIYEDRLHWAYQQAVCHKPQALLACLSSESFEILRLVPPGVLRMGIVQSDDPGPYELSKRYAPWLDVMVGVSETICERLRSLPECKSVRIEHIPYGIHFSTSSPRPTREANAPFRVVYVGRLVEEQKRISRLAALIRRFEQQPLIVEFTVVGVGPDEIQFRTAISDCRNVRLLGSVPNEKIGSILREQDVFILLSDYEGLPLSLLEAMGEGVVPVVSDLASGMREVVDENCGVRVPVGDTEAAFSAISALIADGDRLANLSTAAILKARRNYSAEQMASHYLNLIKACCEARPDPVWPEGIDVPAPLLQYPWLFRGWPRKIRRLIRKAFGVG